MLEKCNTYINELNSNLNFLESETENILVKAEEGIKITKQSLKKLRKLVTNNTFKTKNDEIYFFKNVKPQVYSKLIYYVMLFNIESKRPRSSNKTQIKYFNKHIDKLQLYFNDNLEFYNYYRRGAIFLDEQYFVRGKADIRLHPDTFHFFIDEQFSTSHDSTIATILAYDMLIIDLRTEIEKLQNNRYKDNTKVVKTNTKLFWSASKIDLIELIYALHSTGVINKGTVDIKEMASVCEQIFNIDLRDYYRTFLDIRSRKINQTKFLDKLKETLFKRIEDSDE